MGFNWIRGGRASGITFGSVPGLAAALVVSTCLTACSGSGSDSGHGTPLGVPEEPIDCITMTRDCFVPMPSNLFVRPDTSSPTGARLNLKPENFPTPVATQVLDVYPVDHLNESSGFSPAGPVILPLTDIPDPTSLPADEAASLTPSSSVRLIDMETLAPVPVRVTVDPVGLAADPPAPILVLIAGMALRNGGTYLAVVTDRVRTVDGSAMPAFPGYADLQKPGPLPDPDTERIRKAYAPVFERMRDGLGEDPARTAICTVFTVRADEEITRDMRAIRDTVARRARTTPPDWHPIQTNPEIPIVEDGVGLSLVGAYTSPDYRGPEGKIVYDESGEPVEQRENWLEFVLKLPAQPTRPAPVVIFGHGLGAFKETIVQVTGDLGSRGFAVIGIDVAGHNSRMPQDGFIGKYFRFDQIEQVRDLFMQTIADEMQLVWLVRGALATLDEVPNGGDGVPDLAPGPFYYVGQSLGAVPGVTLVAAEPEIQAGVMNVGGGGFVNMMLESDGLGDIFNAFVPSAAGPTERLALATLAQMLVDPVEPLNFAQHTTLRPFPGHPARDVLLQESIGDHVVPNESTEALARSMGVPLVEPILVDIAGLPHVTAPAAGSGLCQYDLSRLGVLSHALVLLTNKAGTQVAHFFESHLETGKAEVIRP